MATFTKTIDRNTPSQQRSISVDSTELSSGDIIDFIASMGRPVRVIKITTSASSDVSVRQNVKQKIYPRRTGDDRWASPLNYEVNVGGALDVVDQTQASEDLSSTTQETWFLQDAPIKDLEITWTTGTWTLVAR